MTKLILISFLFYQGTVNKIEQIPFHDTLKVTSPLYDLLGVKDTSALIVSVFDNSYWHNARVTSYLVFYPNGKVRHLELKEFKEEGVKHKITRHHIKKASYSVYWNWLDTCISNDLFINDQAKLNIKTRPGKKEGTTEMMGVSDGMYYSYSLHYNRKTLHYSAYEPKTYIDSDYPGKEERIKFLNVVDSFFELIKANANRK